MKNTDQIALTLDQLGRIARELQYSHNLNPAQWEALRYVARANKFSRTPGALADFSGATKGTISQTLIALENKGLIERNRCDKDGRITRLYLTDAGHELTQLDPLKIIDDYGMTLKEDERELLFQSLQNILQIMRHKSRSAEFGFCAKCQSFVPCSSDDTSKAGTCNFREESLLNQDFDLLCANFNGHPD